MYGDDGWRGKNSDEIENLRRGERVRGPRRKAEFKLKTREG